MTVLFAPQLSPASQLVQPQAAIGAWECDLATERLHWTEGVYDIFGLKRGGGISRACTLDLYEPQSRRDMELRRSHAIRTGRGFALDCRIRAADGVKRWMRLVVGIDHRNGRTARIFGSKQDITGEKQLWGELAASAAAALSSAPPPRGQVRDVIGRACRSGTGDHALVLFAIEGTEIIAETRGKEAVETVLTGFADRLRRLFPDAPVIDSPAPGEFAVLLRAPGDRDYLAAMLSAAHKLLGRPILHGRKVVDLAFSAGAVFVAPLRHRSGEAVLAEARAAVQAAQLAGGGRFRIFDGPLEVARPLPA